MEGKKFSASRGVQILVRDFLSRYDPDALRYFLTIAGPETQDTDFTWSEFVRRNNDELVATWGNLVNRTLQSAYKNFGEVPTPGDLTAEDEALLREVERGFDTSARSSRQRGSGTHSRRRCGSPPSGTSTWPSRRPGRSSRPSASGQGRSCTSLFVSSTASRRLLAPFLPFSAQRLHELLGYDDVIAGELEFRTVDEDGAEHVVLTGDYESWVRAVGAQRAPRRAASARAAAALREARRRARRRGGARADGIRRRK